MSKRVVVLAEPETLFLPNFLARLAAEHPIAALIEVPPPSLRVTLRRAWNAFGPVGVASVAASELVARVVDRVSRDRFYSLEKVAERFDIPHRKVSGLHAADCYAALDEYRPDVVFAQVSRLVKPELLRRATFWNKHCALLPSYGGVFPVFWALRDGQPEVGVTVHVMDEEFDRGPILGQATIAVNGHTFFGAYHELYDRALPLLVGALENGAKPVAPRDGVEASYFSFPGRADRAEFRRSGRRFGRAFRLHPRLGAPTADPPNG